ncbi:MAG: hypothetical protein PW788_07455 [Micavibrio sp.]|nr:hypothetical protein [Micavibrio sp.]
MEDRASQLLSKASGNPSWLDIPSLVMLQHIPEVVNDKELCALIAAYHGLTKDSYDTISDRCASLEKVSLHIEKKIICNEASKTLQDIQGTSDRKREYLARVRDLYEAGILVSDSRIYDAEKIRSYFESDIGNKYSSISLNNHIYYDSANARFWGEYWLEIIDPCHRPLEHYKEKWLQERIDGLQTPFFIWLEKHEVSPYHKKTILLSPQEIESLSLKIIDGKIITGAGTVNERSLTTNDSWETLFIITPEKQVFSCPATGNLRHVSLSLGKPLIGAGSLKAKDGVIIELHSDSGHYRPTPEMAKQTLKIFDEMGLKINDETIFYYFDDFKEIKTTVGAFLENNPDQSSKKHRRNPKL